MSKKRLQVEGIVNELEGASHYFNPPTPPPKPSSKPPRSTLVPPKAIVEEELKVDQNNDNVSQHASRVDSINTSMLASNHNEGRDDLIETIRKTVKSMGKEVSFIRLTPEEKHQLSAIVYSFNELYRGQGRKTSENEIGRIALNLLFVDYREHGELSVLAKVLAALNA